MKKIVQIALFAAFIIVLGYVPSVVLPFISVPLVLQNMGPLLAGAVLGIYGVWSVVLFLALALLGFPVLAGGRGGFAVFVGPTAGYLLGYIVASIVVGILMQRNWYYLSTVRATFINIIGVLLMYVCGIPILVWVSGMTISDAIKFNMVFIPFDVLKAILVAIIAMQFKKYYPLIKKRK